MKITDLIKDLTDYLDTLGNVEVRRSTADFGYVPVNVFHGYFEGKDYVVITDV